MSEPERFWPMNRSELIARVEALEAYIEKYSTPCKTCIENGGWDHCICPAKEMRRAALSEKAIGGSDRCHTCAAHVLVITQDLEPRIATLEDLLRQAQKRMEPLLVRDWLNEEITTALSGARTAEAKP